jgi:hypothetical protein
MTELCSSGPSEKTGSAASAADLESHPSTRPNTTIRWPESCPYYNAAITDCWRTRDLLYDDTVYLSPTEDDLELIRWINLVDGVPIYGELKALGKDLFPTILSTVPDAKRSAKILFVRQKRRYYNDSRNSLCEIGLRRSTWEEVLHHFCVPPNFLELLHSNNGAFSAEISYCRDDSTNSQHQNCPENGTSAFHLYLKLGDWGNNEHAVYARHDFHTGHDLVLIMGTAAQDYPARLLAHLRASRKHLGLPQILLYLSSSWLEQVEKTRTSMDQVVRNLESRTGASSLRFMQAPLPRENLIVTGDLYVALDWLRMVSRASGMVREACTFLQVQLRRLSDLTPDDYISSWLTGQIHDALAQNQSLAFNQSEQTSGLMRRIDAQLAITNTIIAHRDSKLTIEIAKATKRDSELMKGIAAVTMIFLPATFLATFFSMVFFHVGTESQVRLTVDSKIWLYPAITAPFTAIVTAWYWSESLGVGRRLLIESLRRWAICRRLRARDESGNSTQP